MWIYIWLGVLAFALIIEFLSSDMVSVWFVGGAFVAMILAALKVPYYVQIPVFIVLSLVMMLCFRKVFIKLLKRDTAKTNAQAFIGKEYRLLSPVQFNVPGTVKINDVIWNVTAEDDKTEIPQGALVELVQIKGNKYIVKEIK